MVNPLLNVGRRFRAKYKTIEGVEFFGQFLDIPDTSRVSNFLSARRYIRTTPTCVLKPRDVVIANGLQYIAAEHGTGFYVDPIYKHFKMFQVDTVETLTKMERFKNPVTGVYESRRQTVAGEVYLSNQPHAGITDSISIPDEVRTAITNAEVVVDDMVGEYIVTKSDVVLGVTLIEMKKI